MYSASAVDKDIEFCFLEDQDTRDLPILSYFLLLLLCFYFNLHLYHKNTKNIILSYLSDLNLVSGLIGINIPYLRWFKDLFVLCRYEGLACSLLLD